MPPVPTAPRLADLDANVIAHEVCTAVLDQSEKLLDVLRGSGHQQPDVDMRAMPLYQIVRDLVLFAQSGQQPEQTTARGAMETLSRVYFGSAEGACSPLGAASPISAVFIAADARRCLARGTAVHHQALAALAGVHPSRIRQLSGGRSPTLHRADRGAIEAKSARAWLQEQGVPGFEAPPSRRRGPGR